MLSVFGYPVAFENSTRRAVDAAIKLRQWSQSYAPPNLEWPIAFHTGINTGLVLLKQGDLERGRYEILGDTTNVASRLGSLAGPGEILISTDSLGSDRHFYDATSPELTPIRSRAQKIYVCKIRGARSGTDSALSNLRHNTTQMVGREKQFQTAMTFLQDPAAGSLLLLRASAGMGKSRFLSELRSECHGLGYRSVWSYCDPYEGQAPLAPIFLMFDEIRRLLVSVRNEEACERCASLLESEFWSETDRQKFEGPKPVNEVLITHFVEAAKALQRAGRGIVIFLDDWHWADRASREFLDQLSGKQTESFRLIIAERHSSGARYADYDPVRVELDDLTNIEAQDLIRQVEPSLDKLMIEGIIERAGGNPLYLEELSYAARLNLSALTDLHADSWLHSLMQARFDLLDEAEKKCLQTAAAIGRIVPNKILRELMDDAAADSILQTLSQKDFLHPDELSDTWKFKHGITAEAIYDHIPAATKKVINRQIGDWITASTEDPDPALLAKYYFRSGDIDLGLPHAIRAGEMSLQDFALDRAQFHLMSALQQTVAAELSEAEIVRLIKLYGQAGVVDPSWSMAADLKTLQRQFNLAGLKVAAVWTQYFLGFIRYGLGQLDHAIEEFQSVKSTAEELGERGVYVRVESTLGQVYAAACRGSAALTELEKSLQQQRSRRDKAAAVDALGYTLGARGMLLMDMGHVDEAQENLSEVAALVEGEWNIASLSVRSFLGASAIINGDYGKADQVFSEVIIYAEKARSHFHLAQSGAFLQLARLFLTGDPQHLELVETAAEQWALQSDHHLSLPYGYLAEQFVQVSDLKRAKFYADKAMERASQGDRYGESMAHRAYACIALEAGRKDEASDEFDAAYRSARERESVRALCRTGYLEQQLGRPAQIDWQTLALSRGIAPERHWFRGVSAATSQ